MRFPKLKRINIDSEQELEVWLSKNADTHESYLVVTNSDNSHAKHVSKERLTEIIEQHGWKSGGAYTVGTSKLRAHLISRAK